jgi:hypothetical protein
MKNHVLVVGFLLSISFIGALQAQNKTLGVGVASPNPNAALHVESPTSNQGFIMPRMTTAQRTNSGFVSALSSPDIGLMVFDIDLVRVFNLRCYYGRDSYSIFRGNRCCYGSWWIKCSFRYFVLIECVQLWCIWKQHGCGVGWNVSDRQCIQYIQCIGSKYKRNRWSCKVQSNQCKQCHACTLGGDQFESTFIRADLRIKYRNRRCSSFFPHKQRGQCTTCPLC